MNSAFYLSEMAVSERHGGGLTIERILGDDLDRFACFIHSHDFATSAAPIMPRLSQRQLNLHDRFAPPPPSPGPRRRVVDNMLGKLALKTTLRWSDERWAERCAAHLSERLDVASARWLIVPQQQRSVRIANRLRRIRSFQYVTWVMDDHVVRWDSGAWRYPPGFETEYAEHLRNASRVFVISGAMGELYRTRFGVESEVLFGPYDPVGDPVVESPDPRGPVRLCYFGAIREWQLDAIAALVSQLPRLGATLDLYCLQPPPQELVTSHVTVRPPVPAESVVGKMREYDGAVIAASFEPRLRHLTELNIATKLSECYASGTVPVIVAPPYAAMSRFAFQHGGALVVSDPGAAETAEAFRNLKNPSERSRILGVARHVSETVCSTAAMRRVWRSAWPIDNAA